MFSDKLINRIKKLNNPTVVGLDPLIEYVPEDIKDRNYYEYGKNDVGVCESILEFNKKIIDNIKDIVAIIKPQLAYYEMYGVEGMRVFNETCEYAKVNGLLVLVDGKRNDIGSTATAYAKAYLGETLIEEGTSFKANQSDCLTVNPYLGIDGIRPFINECKENGKGIFVLVKTSNPSSGELQDLRLKSGETIYEAVGKLVNQWGGELIGKEGYSSIGAVVGATYPEQLKELRSIMPKAYFLVPGYGAQGGGAKDVFNAFNKDGLGAIVNASRSIMLAYKNEKYRDKISQEHFYEASRMEAIKMRDDINKELEML